jgi:cytochrome c-type biogenesis protein CcmH
MTLFWALGAVLAAATLALVLRPLVRARAGEAGVSRRAANIAIYRDQLLELDADLAAGKLAPPDHEKARAELEARLLEDVDAAGEEQGPPRAGKRSAILAGIGVPLAALGIYLAVGSPAAVSVLPGHGDVTEEQIEIMVSRLAARLRENPDDAEGWKMLGRSYAVLGRFGEAVDAYSKAALRAPRDAQLLADFADALAMARGRSLQGEPEKLVQRALEIEPGNLKALALAGTAAFERQAFKTAADYWQRMLPLVPPYSEEALVIRENVALATQLAGGKPPVAPAAALRGSVRISPALKGKYGTEDTVFIYARAADGPPMPLAILRRKAGELPLDFALDDSMAMAPGAELSSFARIVVTARISPSGQAKPQAGDLQGTSATVASDARGVEVVIDTVVR